MSSRKQRPTDDEIEVEVLAKRGDPSAWEILPLVPASTAPRPAWMLRKKHLELAAQFHVLSILHRLGVEANLALAQPDGADITILGRAGQAITIDVKTVEGTGEWLVNPFTAKKHHYVVVVRFTNGQENAVIQPQVYVIASETLQQYVSRRKLKAVPLDALASELAALEAWQRIVSEQAA